MRLANYILLKSTTIITKIHHTISNKFHLLSQNSIEFCFRSNYIFICNIDIEKKHQDSFQKTILMLKLLNRNKLELFPNIS